MKGACVGLLGNTVSWYSPAVQIIPAPVQQAAPTAIKVMKHNKTPRAPRISGEERSSPGNRTGTYKHSVKAQVYQYYHAYLK